MVLILYREPTVDVEAMLEELAALGVQAEARSPWELTVRCGAEGVAVSCEGRPLHPSVVVGWTSLQAREAGYVLLEAFARLGVPIYNGVAALRTGQSKPLTSVLLAAHGLPHLPTLICGPETSPARVVEELGLPVVLKPLVGAQGTGVRPVYDVDELAAEFAAARAENTLLYAQAYLEKPHGDLRIQCIDYVATYAMRRLPAPGAFITNLSAGGRFEPVAEMPAAAVELAERAARLMDAPLAGVDFIETPEGPRIIEVNMTPGIWKAATLAGAHFEAIAPLYRGAVRRLARVLVERFVRKEAVAPAAGAGIHLTREGEGRVDTTHR